MLFVLESFARPPRMTPAVLFCVKRSDVVERMRYGPPSGVNHRDIGTLIRTVCCSVGLTVDEYIEMR